MHDMNRNLITRRRSLALIGSGGAGLLLARRGLDSAFTVDIWHCNASGVYFDISSENTLGSSYLRGVQFTDKHGQVKFNSVFPGHYSGRTTHVRARVHIGSRAQNNTLGGGHICHTGQLSQPSGLRRGLPVESV
jgi:hypothetical protein